MKKLIMAVLLGLSVFMLTGCDQVSSIIWSDDEDEENGCSIDVVMPNGEIQSGDALCNDDNPDLEEGIHSLLLQYEETHRFEKSFQGLFVEDEEDPIINSDYEVNPSLLKTLKENEESFELEPEYSTKTYTFEIQLEGGSLNGSESFRFEMNYGEDFDDDVLSKATTDISKPLLFFDGYYSKRSGLGEQYADESGWSVQSLTYDNFTEAFEAMENRDDQTISIYAYYISEEIR